VDHTLSSFIIAGGMMMAANNFAVFILLKQ